MSDWRPTVRKLIGKGVAAGGGGKTMAVRLWKVDWSRMMGRMAPRVVVAKEREGEGHCCRLRKEGHEMTSEGRRFEGEAIAI
ncbi:hypothetical protein SAY87_018401 [Trapa incisa]|uniref:Uncharacterized protein n=1 Tax=Trapa incisa TaxID=236973 RepID=A0AAN7L5Y9_9MYRT|nr:hypothetical protein SAY87_018401 [Trapa incisa]